MERSRHQDERPVETDLDDARAEVTKSQARTRRPFKPRPPVEDIDVAAVHRELVARYPKIRAKLAE
jgi:hypothetical protein